MKILSVMEKIKGQPENVRMYRDQLLTVDDLEAFKQELFIEMRRLLAGNKAENKRWLKSFEVRKLLNVSPNTLLSLRNKGIIPFTRIGGGMEPETLSRIRKRVKPY
jgi:hypothetical protein